MAPSTVVFDVVASYLEGSRVRLSSRVNSERYMTVNYGQLSLAAHNCLQLNQK